MVQHIPFTGSSWFSKLIEYAVIGGVILFGSVQVLGSKIDGLSIQLTQVEHAIIRQDARIRVVEQESAVNAAELRGTHR